MIEEWRIQRSVEDCRVSKTQRFGSLIRLKPEYEETYIILHRHTFPGVLERIHDSNIRNYSIFLREGMLFSYYEYCGQDYEADMRKIGEDTITRDWWKLTDPMQEPVQDRKEGEWWASMEEVAHFSSIGSYHGGTRRLALRSLEESLSMRGLAIPENIISTGLVQKLSVFFMSGRLYLYCEWEETSHISPEEMEKDVIDTIFSRITFDNRIIHWEPMEKVFHTD